MIVRPGNRLLRIAAVFVVAGLLAFVWAAFAWILGAALVPVAILAWLDGRRASRTLSQLRLARALPKVVGRNLPFENVITVSNDGPSPVVGELRDILPASCAPKWFSSEIRLSPHEAGLTVRGVCRIPIRGKHTFGPVWLRVAGPLKLTEVQREFECLGEVKVLPETFASREELQKDLGAQLLMLNKISRARQVGSGTEFVSLTPYRFGDDPKRIDWRASARHRSPIIRRYQVERHRDVLILVDNGRLMGALTDRGSKLDCAVDAALNLARVALQSGDRCGMAVFDSALRGFLPPVAGAKSLSNLVNCVYDLQTQWRETDFTRMFAEVQHRQSKRSLLVILSDLGDEESSKMHCAALARLSRRHLVLFAALRTPLLRQVVHGETASLKQGAQQTVALGLLRDRRRALYSLKHAGIHVVDVEPQQLSLPLINQFVELRQRNLL